LLNVFPEHTLLKLEFLFCIDVSDLNSSSTVFCRILIISLVDIAIMSQVGEFGGVLLLLVLGDNGERGEVGQSFQRLALQLQKLTLKPSDRNR